jgi:hypothetical protein
MSAVKQWNRIVRLTQRAKPAEANGHTIEMIRERAYQIFLARGATHGDDLADWLRAEQELRATAQG